MTPSPAAPDWAIALAIEVCSDAAVEPPARLAWRRRNGELSTGATRHGDRTIAVRAGDDPLDQRLTLLHELAHWLAPAPRRRRGRVDHHGRAFYALAFRLYARYGLPGMESLRMEAARYPSALGHALALGVDGAAAAIAERRARLRSRPRRRWRVLVPEHAVRLARDGRWTVCSTCRQRVVGAQLARIRRARRPVRHVLMTAAD